MQNVSFGQRVAEDETSQLSKYFIETDQWTQLYNGSVDIVFGAKGAGKSALYTLLSSKQDEFLTSKSTHIIPAENARGASIFSEIASKPPKSDHEFVTLWKIYICQLIVMKLTDSGQCTGKAENISIRLAEAGLIEAGLSFKRVLLKARNFASKLFNVESIEGGMGVDGGVLGKITFQTPTEEQLRLGFISLDDMLEALDDHLESIGHKGWVMFDRLDVSFDDNPELEKMALRALFKVYRDIESYSNIRVKIFLRDDIWKRITADGFREASHITRHTTISWNQSKLLNLIVMRAIDNDAIIEKYDCDVTAIRSNHKLQRELYYQMFPKQVDVGEKQSETFEWIANRVRDGFGRIAPRELIHFYNQCIEQERAEQELGNDKIEEPNIVSKQAIKQSLAEVSKARIEQNLAAEYPELNKYVTKLESKKAEHNLSTLKEIWGTDDEETLRVIGMLVEHGFFDKRLYQTEAICRIPFLFRPHLGIIQGKAF